MTDDLIDRLTADLRPTPKAAVARRLLLGLSVGAVVSVALVGGVLGFRPDMGVAASSMMFWMKFAYTLALAVLALWATDALARPARSAGGRGAWLLLPVALVLALAAWKLLIAPPPMRGAMIMGGSAAVCPWLVITFSLPPLAGLMWAVRGLAPTRPRRAGAMIGLAAGGAGAGAYALHCTESTAAFLAIWYTLGVLAAGALGALLGPRMLRW